MDGRGPPFWLGGRCEKICLRFTKGSKKSKFLVLIEKVGLYSEGLGGQNSTLVRSFEFSVREICVGARLRFYTVRPKIVLEPREVSF